MPSVKNTKKGSVKTSAKKGSVKTSAKKGSVKKGSARKGSFNRGALKRDGHLTWLGFVKEYRTQHPRLSYHDALEKAKIPWQRYKKANGMMQ